MTPAEAAALLTYTSQLDGRILVNDPNADLWAYALHRIDYQQAKWCVREHYASHNHGGPPAALSPGMIRARVQTLNESASAKRAAIAKTEEMKALESVGDVLRSDPDEKPGASRFQQLMEQYQAGMKNV